jgi:hypothetical protein
MPKRKMDIVKSEQVKGLTTERNIIIIIIIIIMFIHV